MPGRNGPPCATFSQHCGTPGSVKLDVAGEYRLKSLLARLLLVVAAAVAPAVAFLAYSESDARHARQQLVEDEALRLVRLVSAEQQRILEGAKQVLDTLASTPAVQDDMRPQCNRILANMLRQSPRYNDIGVAGLDGRLRCSARAADPTINVADRFYFREALRAGTFAVGQYVVGRDSGLPSIHLARPFVDGEGAVQGVLLIALNLNWLGEQLATLPMPAGTIVTVADRNGTVLARFPAGRGQVGGPLIDAARAVLSAEKVGTGQIVSRDGRPRLTAYSPPTVEPRGLAVFVGLERNAMFAPVAEANRIGFLLVIAGAVLALLITALLGKRLIHRPIGQLLEVADRWRRGDLSARSGIASDPGEFGRLAMAFDSMAAAQEARDRALRASEAEQRRLSSQLEARVRQEVLAREDAQARAARAEALSALGQLAGGMAHNFNNVLQAILGAAALIERQPEDQAGVRRRARLALRAAERGAEITRRLLAFGHRSNLQSEEIDARALLGHMRSLVAPVLGGQIRVEIAPAPGRPVLVADKGQLETALLNVAINARDAMADGGRLMLSASSETVCEEAMIRPGIRPGSRLAAMCGSPSPTPVRAWTRRR